MAVSRAAYNRYEYGALRQDPVWFAVNGCFLAKSTFGNDGYFEQRPGKGKLNRNDKANGLYL